MLLSNILQSLSGTINNIYLGQMLGVRAFSAVSGFFPIMFFFIALTIGLGAGASILIGQAWGARQIGTVREIAGSTLTLGISFGLLVTLFGGIFTEPMLLLLKTPPDILPEAARYARIILMAMPALFVFLLSTAMLRGVGDTVSPLFALLISTGTGLVLTPALIRGWLGLPPMGVASGACATVVAFIVATVWLAWYLRRRRSPLAPDAEFLSHMHLNLGVLKKVLRVGIPTGVQMVVVAVAELALLSFVNAFGSGATAAYGAVNQVVAYVQFPAISIAITASILGAQAIGAGHANRLGSIVRTALLMNFLLTGALVLLGYLFSRELMGWFITSAPVVDIAQTLLHIMLWSIVIFGMGTALSGIMRASGTVLVPTAISAGCILIIELPTAWIASRYLGLNGVWVAYPTSFSCMLLLQAAYYRWVWRKKTIRALV
ncbi:MAG: MATE family efflux transporter [Burkholderiaceae bacterium]|nr:MATE family efflux transporter [Burkholderiaceae bacterium]